MFKSYFPYLDNDLYIIIKLHALLIQLFFYFFRVDLGDNFVGEGAVPWHMLDNFTI